MPGQFLTGRAAATALATICSIGNLGGVISPLLTGLVVERTGSYYLAFAMESVILVLGAMSYLILVGEISPLQWTNKALERKVAICDV